MIVFRVNGGGPRRPVARIGDDHQCPKRNDDGSAHKGGPVVTGSPTMKANGRPVARVGDKVHCNGSTDTVIKGIDNLLVDGKPIAVQGSKCAHGGLIVEGSPNVFVEEYTDAHKAEHFAKMRAMGIDVDEHWIQGQYLDGDGNGVYGMPYRIIHEDGTEANGTLDHDGKTAKMQYLSQGTATIHFGDRPGLEEELQDERKQLKKYLDNILAKSRAYAKAHPDKIADENEYERLLTENLAFAKGLGIGAVKLVKGTASGVAHLFKIAAMDIRESADTIDGDNQDYNKVAKEETAQGRAIVTNIEKGKHLLELVYEDQPTRSMLQKFAEDYYLSETPMMIAKEAGEAAGGLIPGILVALMLGSPELVPAEVASETGADISGVAAVANRMARTLKELKETKDIEQAEVGQIHVLDESDGSYLDYSQNFDADLKNFNPGAKTIKTQLESDLVLKSFHSDKPLGDGRSAMWWTNKEHALSFESEEQLRQSLALPDDWGPRDYISTAVIPKNTEVEFHVGIAAPQITSDGSGFYMGGGIQYRFKSFNLNWIKKTQKLDFEQGK